MVWVLTWLVTLVLGPVTPALAQPEATKYLGRRPDTRLAPSRQRTAPGETATQPTPAPTSEPIDVAPLLAKMSVTDKVGQLFLVTFQGNDVSENSDIATLVRDYRVGGVALLPANGNFRSVPVDVTSPQSSGRPGGAKQSTPEQILRLTNALQFLAMSTPQPITTSVALTSTVPVTPTLTFTPTVSATAEARVTIPLLIGVDWTGDDMEIFSGAGGFSPYATEMALGATWAPDLAAKTGELMGTELSDVGVNLLLGPTLDVLDVPRPGDRGDLGVRAFGGDPYWVGRMGQAFIGGIQSGSAGRVLTAAKHFPGQGGSDRRPEDEVATIQKSVDQLRQIELAPFAAVTAGGDPLTPGVTAALMTSHIRYRGFQGNIRQLTPPISLAPQLQDLMGLNEFAQWREAGGVLISDALGVPALRRYYDPALLKFPHRQVAQDAFLAGNDLLYLSRFALTDDWESQYQAIQETILFFQDKYVKDADFKTRVDAAVERILRMKLRAYGGSWENANLQQSPVGLDTRVGQGSSITTSAARAGLTLIDPGPQDLADRMPTAPLADEKILIFTDAREVAECPDCEPLPIIASDALEEIILRLYGPEATGQVNPENIKSLTYEDLYRLLTSPPGSQGEIERAIAEARWLVFGQLEYNPSEYPESAALRTFLSERSDSLRDKRLVVLSFRAPYYLDTTEISKLTAYFGVYAADPPFLEMAVRALFREFTPVGAPPVSVPGINYDLIRQLEPDPGQVINLTPIGPAEVISGSIQVGSQIELEAGIILDRKGHPVPDGTPVEFELVYPTEGLALAPQVETTAGGKAQTSVALDRPGELWITARAGEAVNSTRIQLKVGGDSPGSIATVIPTATPPPTSTATATPEPTPTATVTPAPSPTPTPPPPAPPPPEPRVAFPAFLFAFLGTFGAAGMAFILMQRRLRQDKRGALSWAELLAQPTSAALWAGVAGWVAYLLYATGLLPGATQLQSEGRAWAAGAICLLGGLLTLFWTARASARPSQRRDNAPGA
jgi:beta-N-acetylhexosaminidase